LKKNHWLSQRASTEFLSAILPKATSNLKHKSLAEPQFETPFGNAAPKGFFLEWVDLLRQNLLARRDKRCRAMVVQAAIEVERAAAPAEGSSSRFRSLRREAHLMELEPN
jgi:hypothetical protein